MMRSTLLCLVLWTLLAGCGGGDGGGDPEPLPQPAPTPLPELAGLYSYASLTLIGDTGQGPFGVCGNGYWVRDPISGAMAGSGVSNLNGQDAASGIDRRSEVLPGSQFRAWANGFEPDSARTGWANAARTLALTATASEGAFPDFELAWRAGAPAVDRFPAEHHYVRIRWDSAADTFAVGYSRDLPVYRNQGDGPHTTAVIVNEDGERSSVPTLFNGHIESDGTIGFTFPTPEFRQEGDLATGACHIGDLLTMHWFIREASGLTGSEMTGAWHAVRIARLGPDFGIRRGPLDLVDATSGTFTPDFESLEGVVVPDPAASAVTYVLRADGALTMTLGQTYHGAMAAAGDFAVLVGADREGDPPAILLLMRAVADP